ncbi:hypothetical protein ACJIZ3_010097 [Penstemon smallii]|uniref:Uncharacterized protein n=1 Tax=Penstemon smallii TaxID=265156 RepID=A0ABD3TFH5_9LAMI
MECSTISRSIPWEPLLLPFRLLFPLVPRVWFLRSGILINGAVVLVHRKLLLSLEENRPEPCRNHHAIGIYPRNTTPHYNVYLYTMYVKIDGAWCQENRQ